MDLHEPVKLFNACNRDTGWSPEIKKVVFKINTLKIISWFKYFNILNFNIFYYLEFKYLEF